jgi:hypothetical protein
MKTAVIVIISLQKTSVTSVTPETAAFADEVLVFL